MPHALSPLTTKRSWLPRAARRPMARARAVLLACGLLVALPALAGNVLARAGQNPNSVQDINDGMTASASWGPIPAGGSASAETSRLQVSYQTLGWGASSSLHMNAMSSHRTDYELWDLSTGTPLADTVAGELVLDFGFRLVGQLQVDAESLSNATLQWSAALYSTQIETAGSSANLVFGPVPGNLSGAYVFSGDPSLRGSFDQSFTLRHHHDGDGVLTMATSGLSGNRARSEAWLTVTSLTLVPPLGATADGLALNGGPDLSQIGIRLVQTGQILAVTPVPEPGTWALWLAGAGMMAWRLRGARTRSGA